MYTSNAPIRSSRAFSTAAIAAIKAVDDAGPRLAKALDLEIGAGQRRERPAMGGESSAQDGDSAAQDNHVAQEGVCLTGAQGHFVERVDPSFDALHELQVPGQNRVDQHREEVGRSQGTEGRVAADVIEEMVEDSHMALMAGDDHAFGDNDVDRGRAEGGGSIV